jgi:HK97 family phage portal protein
VSILRRAAGRPHEERPLAATGVTILPSSGGVLAPDVPGYGTPGFGSWADGMVWQSWAGASGAVTVESASRLSAVWGCWRLLTNAVATSPADTFIRDGGVRKPYRPRPKYLEFQPPQMGKIAYLTQVELSMLMDGNAFIGTPRDRLGVPTDLIPLQPDRVDVCRENGRIHYEIAGIDREFSPWEIMHIPGLLPPGGLRGMSPIQAAREIIDGAHKAQEYGRNFAANMAVPPAVIEVPGMGSGNPEAENARAKKIAGTWKETHGGANAGNVGVLLGGAQLKTIAISPEDAQWLESKKFTVSEICRIYGVPPHLVADASNSTSWGSGLAEQNTMFSAITLQPDTERIEEAHNRLLTTHGLPDVFWRLNLDAKLRSAPKERAETMGIQIANRSMTINEARALEDRPPVPWGDDFAYLDNAKPVPTAPPPGGGA